MLLLTVIKPYHEYHMTPPVTAKTHIVVDEDTVSNGENQCYVTVVFITKLLLSWEINIPAYSLLVLEL